MVRSKIKKNKLIILIIALAFFLRTYKLYDNLFFGWEQGRDFLKYGNILAGDLLLVGPKTDIAGIFHGNLSYYLFLPFYILFQGSPYLMSLILIFINSVAIYFLFEFTRELFSKKAAYLASIFYAVSYSSIIYNRWLLHETLVPALTILCLYSLLRSFKSPQYLIFFAFSWALAFHLAIQMSVIMLLLFLVFLFYKKPNYSKNIIISSLAILIFFASPFLVFDIKNEGITRNAVSNYLSEDREIVERNVTLDELKNEIRDNIYPSSLGVSLSIFLFALTYLSLVKSKNKKDIYLIISLLLIMPLVFYFFSFKPLRHFYIYLTPVVSIILAIFISKLYKQYKLLAILLFMFLIFGNLKTIFDRVPESKANFIHHAQRTYLSDEIALIDYVYAQSNGEDFTYNYYSIPYWQPQVWEYLFLYYGLSKYGYEPIINTRTNIFYVVYEPDETQPLYQENWLKDMNKESTLLDSFKSGKLTAEKRQLK